MGRTHLAHFDHHQGGAWICLTKFFLQFGDLLAERPSRWMRIEKMLLELLLLGITPFCTPFGKCLFKLLDLLRRKLLSRRNLVCAEVLLPVSKARLRMLVISLARLAAATRFQPVSAAGRS